MASVEQEEGFQDRVGGSLLGLAAGDALGAAYEFTSNPPAKAEMVGGGVFDWEPGEWTDDTQMAICVAEVTATGSCDPEAIGQRFMEWYREGPTDVGNQTAAVLRRAEKPSDLAELARSYFASNRNNSAGNGSLMRTAPVALAHLGDDGGLSESAMAVSNLTHADPLAGEACVLWCVAIERAVREARIDGLRDGLALLSSESRDRWRDWIDEAETEPARSFKPNGFVVKALQAAHAAVAQTQIDDDDPKSHLESALYTAVAIGHDTDTVAAIAGSLLGARWGASAVPEPWRAILHGWPGYKGEDLVRLALSTAGDSQLNAQIDVQSNE
jgi:ADP-ribosyl-[dinitrogen reductase] hydrolase